MTLLASVAIYDMFALRRVHIATLVAVAFAILLRILGTMASTTDFGTDFVKGLA